MCISPTALDNAANYFENNGDPEKAAHIRQSLSEYYNIRRPIHDTQETLPKRMENRVTTTTPSPNVIVKIICIMTLVLFAGILFSKNNNNKDSDL